LADRLELVHLARLDDEDVPRGSHQLLAFDLPPPLPLEDDLYLVVGMAVRARPGAGLGAEQADGDADVALVGTDERVRASLEREILLPRPNHGSARTGEGSRDRGSAEEPFSLRSSGPLRAWRACV